MYMYNDYMHKGNLRNTIYMFRVYGRYVLVNKLCHNIILGNWERILEGLYALNCEKASITFLVNRFKDLRWEFIKEKF